MPYNYDKFSVAHYDLDRFTAPTLGDKAPDFALETIDAGQQRLLDFDGDFLVLEMGSITCPLFQGRRKKMADLVTEFPNVSFAILYVREAHPGAIRGKHHSENDKLEMATALCHEDNEKRRIFVDGLNGPAHSAYGEFPNAVFIINRKGCVVYRSDWNNAAATGRALMALQSGKPAPREGMFFPVKPPVLLGTFRKAGKGSARDFLLGLPRLIWKNLIKRNLRILLDRPATVNPDATC